MTVLRKSLRLAPLENPSIPLSSPNIIQYLGGGHLTPAGMVVTEENAMRMSAVNRCVALYASNLAGLPLKTYKNSRSGARVETSPALFQGEMYPDISWFEGIETLVVQMLLWGDGFAFKGTNEAGQIDRLLPILPERVTVTRGEITTLNPSGKYYEISNMHGEKFTPNEILQIPWMSFDGLRGIGPIACAKNAIGSAVAAEDVGSRMFNSGLLMGGYLKTADELDEEQAARAKRRWFDKVSGVSRAYDVALLDSGYEFVPMQLPPAEAQWLESRNFGVEDVARFYGVPLHLLDMVALRGNSTAEDTMRLWVVSAFSTVAKRVEKRLSLLLPKNEFCEFNLDGMVQGDSKTESEVFAKAVQFGWMTRNEVRALKNLPPLEGLDEPLTPINLGGADNNQADPGVSGQTDGSTNDGGNPPNG